MCDNERREDLAWAAGFLDGEGSFMCNATGKYAKLCLDAPQVRREPLDRLVSILGGKVYGPYDNGRNCQPIYVWRVHSFALATEIIEALWPWLSEPSREKATFAQLEIKAIREMNETISVRIGSDHWNAKLTTENVSRIRELREAGNSIVSLAKKFLVSKATINDIVTRRTWQNV